MENKLKIEKINETKFCIIVCNQNLMFFFFFKITQIYIIIENKLIIYQQWIKNLDFKIL